MHLPERLPWPVTTRRRHRGSDGCLNLPGLLAVLMIRRFAFVASCRGCRGQRCSDGYVARSAVLTAFYILQCQIMLVFTKTQ